MSSLALWRNSLRQWHTYSRSGRARLCHVQSQDLWRSDLVRNVLFEDIAVTVIAVGMDEDHMDIIAVHQDRLQNLVD